jgi:surfactin synthase thioesterase subunit
MSGVNQKSQLFLIPFAGGNRYSYQFLKSHLTGFECITLELPGRGRRMKEPFLKNFDEACSDIFDQMRNKIAANRILIYGHSMGALIALKVAGMLEHINVKPAYIIVTGNPGPGVKEGKTKYLLNDNEFKEELKLIGGVPDDVFNNEQLLNYFIPILRTDFEVLEKNSDAFVFPAITAPIYAVMGSEEECNEEITNWAAYTKSSFQSTIVKGNHFFIYENAGEIARIINLGL